MYDFSPPYPCLVDGTYSDKNGYFVINDVSEGNYLLKVSYLGYKPQSRNANLSAVRLYQTMNRFGNDSTYQTNRRGFGAQGVFLQFSYRYNCSWQKSDPATYDFPDYSDEAFADVINDYREWTRLFGYLDNPYEMYLSDRLSRYSERTENNHNIDLQLRVVASKGLKR